MKTPGFVALNSIHFANEYSSSIYHNNSIANQKNPINPAAIFCDSGPGCKMCARVSEGVITDYWMDCRI
ncbi:MAG: hypothetical protein AB7U98_01330 [Candidatus Nitrosocosmicus sp.]